LKQETEEYIDLLVREPSIARTAQPGQFVMIRAWTGFDPLLPRPFDIVQSDAGQGMIRLFIKVEGRATTLLKALKSDGNLQIAGPLGRAVVDFSCSSLAFLVRGAGAAAVVYLAEEAHRREIQTYTILSASTASRVVCRKYLEPVSSRFFIATDDGTAGYHGLASDLLDRLLEDTTVDRVFTCGSRRLARHVQDLDREGRTEGHVFLEGLMACGLGDCHGCAVKKVDQTGYFLVCQDGPHFPISKVVIE